MSVGCISGVCVSVLGSALWVQVVMVTSCPVCGSVLGSADRAQVTLDLDGIVQVLDRHLHDSSTGMMTRIAVLKWLYHLYIKTPRKVSGHSGCPSKLIARWLAVAPVNQKPCSM